MDVVTRLQQIDWPTRWSQLGVHDDDREPLQRLVDEIQQRPDELAIVQQLADEVLLPGIGQPLTVYADDRAKFADEFADHDLMRGALPTVALLATADDVHAAHTARGIPDELSWQTLADFGHQVAKCRWVEGTTGNHNQNWLRNAWSDGFLWLGRLQFELTPSTLGGGDDAAQVPVIGVHIPDAGPLKPEAVDQALADAAFLFPRFYPEWFGDAQAAAEHGAPEWFTCHSWLLDPQLQTLVPGSNMAHFQARWQLWSTEPADRDGYYFGFNIEPEKGRDLPYGVDELPTDSRLHAAMVELWRSGGHIQAGAGKIAIDNSSAR